jgi:hypothetical protein
MKGETKPGMYQDQISGQFRRLRTLLEKIVLSRERAKPRAHASRQSAEVPGRIIPGVGKDPGERDKPRLSQISKLLPETIDRYQSKSLLSAMNPHPRAATISSSRIAKAQRGQVSAAGVNRIPEAPDPEEAFR